MHYETVSMEFRLRCPIHEIPADEPEIFRMREFEENREGVHAPFQDNEWDQIGQPVQKPPPENAESLQNRVHRRDHRVH